MPITDTDFTGKNEAKRQMDLQNLMKSIQDKESVPDEKLAVVILAAGLGKRMKSPDTPKVMFTVKGRPIIEYVFQLAVDTNPDLIIPIVGHHREQVIEHLENYIKNSNGKIKKETLKFAVQEEQLGTGHAVMQTEKALEGFNGEILILSGDVPLLKLETVDRLIDEHYSVNHQATLLTTVFKNVSGYGRIIRDEKGKFLKIVEDKDATEEEKKIHEINPAIYMVNSKVLFDALKKIQPNNNQKEYYLTDIFHFIPNDKVGTVITNDEIEVSGINSLEQLHEIEKMI